MGSDIYSAMADYDNEVINEAEDDILIDELKARGYKIFYNGEEV